MLTLRISLFSYLFVYIINVYIISEKDLFSLDKLPDILFEKIVDPRIYILFYFVQEQN